MVITSLVKYFILQFTLVVQQFKILGLNVKYMDYYFWSDITNIYLPILPQFFNSYFSENIFSNVVLFNKVYY